MDSCQDQLLELFKALFSIENCTENYEEKFEPFFTACIKCKDKNSRLTLLKKKTNLEDGVCESS